MKERYDMTVACGDGIINLRVGAIILKDGKMLMVGNPKTAYYYTVGGRMQFGENPEEAVVREVREETGVELQIDRLGFVEQNYYLGDAYVYEGVMICEIGFYFYMKVPEDFEPASRQFTEGEEESYLCWIDPLAPVPYFPVFLHEELKHPSAEVKYIQTDECPAERRARL